MYTELLISQQVVGDSQSVPLTNDVGLSGVTTQHKLVYVWLLFSHSLHAFNTYQNTQHTLQNREAHKRQEYKLHDTIRKGTRSPIGITYHGSIPYYIKCTNNYLWSIPLHRPKLHSSVIPRITMAVLPPLHCTSSSLMLH